MKNKLAIILATISGLLLFSCHSPTGPQGDGQSSLTGKIAFSEVKADSIFIYTINPNGTDLKKVNTSLRYSDEPLWSPDGSQIAFISRFPGSTYSAIYIMNADGSNVHLIPAQPEYLATGDSPSWSPDGSKIAYTHFGEINGFGFDYTVIVSLADGNTLNLAPDTIAKMDYSPLWNPDGNKIIFRSNRDYYKTNPAKMDLYMMDANGQNVKRLTEFGANIFYLWSLSGQLIYFSVYPATSDVNVNGLYSIDSTGNIHQFYNGQNTGIGSLSSNGENLAFSSEGQIYILNIQTGDIKQVQVNGASGLKYYAPINWSADDKYILVISATTDQEHYYLDMINLSDGSFNRLVQSNKSFSADWHK